MKKILRFIIAIILTITISVDGLCEIKAAAESEVKVAYALNYFQPGGKLIINVGDTINLRYVFSENGRKVGHTLEYDWASTDNRIVSLDVFENGQNTIVRTKALAIGTVDIVCTAKKDGSVTKMSVTVQDTRPKLTIKARETSVKYASKWRTLLGIDGIYERVAKNKILKRINEIRYEACNKGYPNPEDKKKKLTTKDYVPIKWSSDLEWIAQIRATEATVREDHDRPNGRPCFSVTHNGVKPTAECLAWNNSGIMAGIEQWYKEKNDWVKQKAGKVTGHYESLISPNSEYIGIGGFAPKSGGWHGIAAEFVSEKEAIYSVYYNIREVIYGDNYASRDEKYYDESLYNDDSGTDNPFFIIYDIPDKPDGLDSLEDLKRLYGYETVEEFAKMANAGKAKLNLSEKQSSLKGRTIQMVEVNYTKVGNPKIDAPKSIKKGKKKQIFVTRKAYNVSAVVLDAKWKSSKPSVISIKADGTITAKKKGKATLTAKFGAFTVKQTITVTK